MPNIEYTFEQLLDFLRAKANEARGPQRHALTTGLDQAKNAARDLGISGWIVQLTKPGWVTELETQLGEVREAFATSQANLIWAMEEIDRLRREVERLTNLSPEQLIRQAVTDITTVIDQKSSGLGGLIGENETHIKNFINSEILPKFGALEGLFEQLANDIISRLKAEFLPALGPPVFDGAAVMEQIARAVNQAEETLNPENFIITSGNAAVKLNVKVGELIAGPEATINIDFTPRPHD